MELDYAQIFNIFADILKNATPISIFLYLANIMINFFFSLAFPKFSKGDR